MKLAIISIDLELFIYKSVLADIPEWHYRCMVKRSQPMYADLKPELWMSLHTSTTVDWLINCSSTKLGQCPSLTFNVQFVSNLNAITYDDSCSSHWSITYLWDTVIHCGTDFENTAGLEEDSTAADLSLNLLQPNDARAQAHARQSHTELPSDRHSKTCAHRNFTGVCKNLCPWSETDTN